MKKHLYEITTNIETLWSHIEEILENPMADSLLYDAAIEAIDGELKVNEEERAKKALDIACLIKEYEAEAAAIGGEVDRLKKRQKTAENKAEWLRGYVSSHCAGIALKDARAAITWRSSKTVEVLVPADKLPERFVRVKTETVPNLVALRGALEAGDASAAMFAKLTQKQNIQVK